MQPSFRPWAGLKAYPHDRSDHPLGDMRILSIEEVASKVRANRDATETRNELIGSCVAVSRRAAS